jgi:tetratricopeptide (TPR) repeat protein
VIERVINSAVINREQLRLEHLAHRAYRLRDLPAMKAASKVLLRLPSHSSQAIGLYYAALTFKRQGAIDEAKNLLEQIVTHQTVEARALLSLGACSLVQGQYDEAQRLHLEASKAGNFQEKLTALWNISEIKSIAGDHSSSLSELSNLWPMVRVASCSDAYLLYHWHNDIAFELAAVGKFREAQEHSHLAVRSSLAFAYPEWQETNEEIEQQLQRPVQVVVVTPLPEQHQQSVRPAAVVLIYACDIHVQSIALTRLTRASLQPLALSKPFKYGPPSRAPPTPTK